jgi:ubiquitin-conjugating enzyme E2 G1
VETLFLLLFRFASRLCVALIPRSSAHNQTLTLFAPHLLPPDFEGGLFPSLLTFPKEYPNKPPEMKFTTPGFWHPNIHEDGKVCISILHEAKEDQFNEQELMSEKWRPILGPGAVLISVLSMLGDPNPDSPANIDASVEYKNDRPAFKKRIRKLVRQSLESL